jgi:hypothetical protein
MPLRVTQVEPGGAIRLEPAEVSSPFPLQDLFAFAEGHDLVASPQLLPGLKPSHASRQLDSLVRIEVTDVGEKDTLTARSDADVASVLKPGDIVVLARPVILQSHMSMLNDRLIGVIPGLRRGRLCLLRHDLGHPDIL